MLDTYIVTITNFHKSDENILTILKNMLRDKSITTYSVLGPNAALFKSEYGTYFLNELMKLHLKKSEFIFLPFDFANFGGDIIQTSWDDIEKTFPGSLDALLDAHDEALARRERDHSRYYGEARA